MRRALIVLAWTICVPLTIGMVLDGLLTWVSLAEAAARDLDASREAARCASFVLYFALFGAVVGLLMSGRAG